MKRILLLALLAAAVLSVTGCCNPRSGSREFIPGQGWVPND
jgi:hypothetical protein